MLILCREWVDLFSYFNKHVWGAVIDGSSLAADDLLSVSREPLDDSVSAAKFFDLNLLGKI